MLVAHLGELTVDYRQLRKADYTLRSQKVDVITPSRFAAWMKSRGQLGGQHKVPRIIQHVALFESLKKFAGLAPSADGNASSQP